MSDFLGRVVAKELGAEAGLRPRLPSRFEPPRDAPNAATDIEDNVQPHRAALPGAAAPVDAVQRGTPPPRPETTPPPATHEHAPIEVHAPPSAERPHPRREEVPAPAARLAAPADAEVTPRAPGAAPPRTSIDSSRRPAQPVSLRVTPGPSKPAHRMTEPGGSIVALAPRAPARHESRPERAAPAPVRSAPPEAPRVLEADTVVQVHIGRIEVRAAAITAPAPEKPTRARPMPLAEYLGRRGGRGAS